MLLSRNKKTGFWTNSGDYTLINTHDPSVCFGSFCAIHDNPSNHPLKDAPLNWREDRGILERICSHGVGHPDFDAAEYLKSIGHDLQNNHGCDGCCGIL